MFDIDAVLTVHTLLLRADRACMRVVLIPFYAALSLAAFQGVRVPAGAVVQWYCDCAGRISRARARAPRAAALAAAAQAQALSPAAKQAGLALLLKFFFAPLMINWCLTTPRTWRTPWCSSSTARGTAQPDAPCSTARCSGRCSRHPVRRHAAVHARLHRRGARAAQSHPQRGSHLLRLVRLPGLLSAVQRLHRPLPRVAVQRLPAFREQLRVHFVANIIVAGRHGHLLLGVGRAGLQGQQPHQSRHRRAAARIRSCAIPPMPPRTSRGG